MRANWPNSRPSSDAPVVFGRPPCLELDRPKLTRSESRGFAVEGRFTGGIIGYGRHYEGQEIDAILLSLNRDFSHIVNYPPKNYEGIVALQMHNQAEIVCSATLCGKTLSDRCV